MLLSEQINKDIITAMKAKEQVRLDVLRYLKARFIENKTSVKPVEEMDVLIAHYKKTKDSISTFPAGHEMAAKIANECKVLEEYMPKQLTVEEVTALINEIKAANPGANMGGIMKELQPKIKGQFDGKAATDLVKAALA